jgi:membrane fusion protein, multidrug efflux system
MSVLSDTRARMGQSNIFFRILLMASIPVVLIAIAAYLYLTAGRSASTDDAYVQADKIEISSSVSAHVVAIEVKDNQSVKTGQVLIKLDDSSYKIALAKAQANLAATKLQIDGLRATYKQRQSDVKAAQDTVDYMQREADRQAQLLATHITSQQKYDEARHNLDAAKQQLSSALQQLNNILASLGGNADIPTEQHPLVLQAQAQVDQAQLDLSNTVIAAPADGYVTEVSHLPVGQYLTASMPAFDLVTTDHSWIEANFKETDLTRMRPGQNATIDIDTYPDRTFHGHVQSISAGTGSEFSVLPPQNSTGNWVKIVQRVPVKLVIDDVDPDRPLRAGMSANVTVDTRTLPPWNSDQTASSHP